MIDLSQIQLDIQLATGIALVLPQSDVGIKPQLTSDAAFYFDFNGEDSVDLDCDITDHVVEDNTALQDQISIKPERVHMRGYVGEINNIAAGIGGLFGTSAAHTASVVEKTAISKLTLLSALIPEVSLTALIAYNTAAQAAATLAATAKAGIAAARTISGEGIQTNQQKAYAIFKGYRKSRTLFTVQTPWEVFQDMAIETMRVVQGAESESFSTFDVTFKQIRTAKTSTNVILLADGRANASNSPVVDQGSQVPSPGPELKDALDAAGTA